jgi:F-box/leucine-rich repeat protein 10/11
MNLEEWANYFNTPASERGKIINVITLEIGDTELGKLVIRPNLVRDLDWVDFGIVNFDSSLANG